VHGLAAEQWSADHGGALGGLLAMELAENLPLVLHRLRDKSDSDS
jgi:hypothetical protein